MTSRDVTCRDYTHESLEVSGFNNVSGEVSIDYGDSCTVHSVLNHWKICVHVCVHVVCMYVDPLPSEGSHFSTFNVYLFSSYARVTFVPSVRVCKNTSHERYKV